MILTRGVRGRYVLGTSSELCSRSADLRIHVGIHAEILVSTIAYTTNQESIGRLRM